MYWNATLLRRLGGADIDADARIPCDVICAAAEADPEIWPVLRAGWRPKYADGPSRDELAAALTEPALQAAVT